MKSWIRESSRIAILLASASSAALATNALCRHPVPLLDPSGPGAWAGRERRMTPEELRRAWDEGRALILLDVRPPEATRQGRPRRALQVPGRDFLREYSNQDLSSVLRAAEGIVVMCGSEACPQADLVAASLRKLGHQNLWVLEGGWEAYQNTGLDCVKP